VAQEFVLTHTIRHPRWFGKWSSWWF